jgi:molybdopterin converting factor small subunit
MVTIRVFARYRELLGFQNLEIPVPTPPTLEGLLLDSRFKALPSEALLAVNQEFSDRLAVLKDGDEIALMPPVSGG